MFSDSNLDTPPPRSQFRRPWSPQPYDPVPSSSNTPNVLPDITRDRHLQDEPESSQGLSPLRHQRLEASDVSVDALDLADYAKTLRMRQAEDPYPPFPSQILQQTGQSSAMSPSFPPAASSQDHPPSLVSRGITLSSNTTHHTNNTHHSSPSVPSRGHRAAHRPFSLPVTPSHTSHSSPSRQHLYSNVPSRPPYIVDPDAHPSPSEEIDISKFPKWSRGWYDSNHNSARHHAYGENNVDPDADIYNPLPVSQFESMRPQKGSPFDPGYTHNPRNSDPHNPYGLPLTNPSINHNSSRDLLPWSNDPPEYGPAVHPMLKEERMRMLEREFGGKDKPKGDPGSKLLVDSEGRPLVGTVDENGNLVTSGPKRRALFRALQIILSLGAAIPSIYAAITIKPQDPKSPPPPTNTPPAYVLYILSCLTSILLLYLFVVRPCCCVRSKPKRSSKHPLGPAAELGMMVLPVGNDKKTKKPKGGKKGKGKHRPNGGQGDVQVNLIVDPTAFQHPDASDEDSGEDESDSFENGVPSGYQTRKKMRRRRRRRGLFEGLAMEEEWRLARAWAKKLAFVDAAGLVLWGAAFIFVLIGKRCPSGAFNGWCNAYNVSTAAACLLCIAFGVSTFFDVQDLYASKQSPRTRG